MVETEDRVAAGRRFYNGNVRAYNTRFDTFPSSVVANVGKFEKREYYEVDDPNVRAAPSLRGAFDSLTTPPLGQPAVGGQGAMPDQPPQTPPAPPIQPPRP
jgi:LemA protein